MWLAAVVSPFADSEPTPAEILRYLGRSPTKGLGQHFLHDRNVVRRIVEFAGIEPLDTVVEIGPGLGILTAELVRHASQVVAIEMDSALADWLQSVAPPNLQIIRGDALSIAASAYPIGPYKVVANLPYNAGNAIVRRLLELPNSPATTTVMVQREVAERMVATPPNMSLLALSVQFFGRPQIGFRVGRGAFLPPPRVDSAVIRVDRHDPPLARDSWQAFFALARRGFGQRRKQLANTLAGGTDMNKDQVREILTQIGHSPTARAEELSVSDWITLFHATRNPSA